MRYNKEGQGESRGPDRTTLRRWLQEGMTQQQIANRWMEETGYHCGRSTVGESIRRWGLKSAHPRPRYSYFVPWQVRMEHLNSYHVRMLRALERRTRGSAMPEAEISRLESWLRELRDRDAVVHYDPNHERGFVLVRRQESDGDDVIRRPGE